MRSLADVIERLIVDPHLRGELGHRARDMAVAQFSPERMAVQLAEVFGAVGQPAIAYSA
jgi:hypothetical protein